MAKLIALKSGEYEIVDENWGSNFSNIKQQALFFDQIEILRLSSFYRTLEKGIGFFKKSDPNLSHEIGLFITELEWLQQKGIIFDLKIEDEFSNPDFIVANIGQQFENSKSLLTRLLEIIFVDLKNIEDETRKKELREEQQLMILRLMAIIMEATKGVTTVTTFPYTKYTRKLPNSNKSNVAQIVISELPLPNNETPWEQIIDYRNDEDNKKNLLDLRRWIRKISTESLSPVEIEEELEWLLNEFQNHIKLHKLKANTETLEVMAKVLRETIENLIKLKFSKLPEPLFALKKRQINLMEAELNAPGREMSYIIKTQESFQTRDR